MKKKTLKNIYQAKFAKSKLAHMQNPKAYFNQCWSFLTFSDIERLRLYYKQVPDPKEQSGKTPSQQNYDIVEEDGSKIKPSPGSDCKFNSLRHFF